MFNPIHFTTWQWLAAPALIFARYFFYAAIGFLIFYVWRRRSWLAYKIQQRFPKTDDYKREIFYSALTSVIFAGMGRLFLGTSLRQYTQFYTDIQEYGWGYLFLSLPLTILIHDTWFYWTHRLMHHRSIYRYTHRVHHLSVNPSPWAAYSFHPLEAILEAGIVPVLLIVMPLHPITFFGFITVMLAFNVYGHLGYELFPPAVYRHPLGRWLNTSVYHNLHHERFTGNYGLYFTFWDRICGTLRTDSDDKIIEVHQRISAQQPEKS